MSKNEKIVAKDKIVWTACGFFAGVDADGDDVFTRDRAQAKLLSAETAKNVAAYRSHMQPSVRQA